MELQTYKFRIYPSNKQKVRIINSLKTCKIIYNDLLALSIDSWKYGSISLNKFDFNKYLTGKFKDINAQSRENISDRVYKSLCNFFRRVKDKSCKEKGYPRFKSRINSISFRQSGFKILSNRKLRISKIGNVPVVLHRVPKGKIKTLTIKQNKAEQWFATITCEIKTPYIKHNCSDKIGLDVGLENYAVLSNGEFIENPKYIIRAEKKLKLLQRRLSRKRKGSMNRIKARFKVARLYNKITNQRMDFLHKLSHRITKTYSFIVIENLNIRSMLNNHWLIKGINDASWNVFIKNLEYKAVTSGSNLVKINPRNTSKTCSKCGTIIKMSLSDREFICSNCGFTCHRDLNASINILKVGTDCAKLNAYGHNVRPLLVEADMDEIGTICEN